MAWRVEVARWTVVSWLLSGAAATAASAPATLAFTVSAPNPAAHVFQVRLRCDGLAGGRAVFRMPAWTPGYYGLFDYAGNIRDVAAADRTGAALAVTRTGPSEWTVEKGTAPTVVLSYAVLANSPFVANAFLDETRGYITPGALFVYVPGLLRNPVTVTIELPPRWTEVATGLELAGGAGARTYAAPTFDVLYDSPILMGNLESLPEFRIGGVPHRFVGYQLGEFDRQPFVDDLRAVVQAGTQIIGDIPYRHYTFIGIGPGRGGIEHLNSAAVPFSGPGADHAARVRTLSFLAHEYFHNYNVKRIRPAALGPFDYDRPNVTNMLWVSEGFTVYYEYLMLARSGRMTRRELLDALGATIATCEKTPGRLFQSAEASSRDSWTQGPFGGRGPGIPRTISYYDKGAVLGLLLDFRIRHATANRRSLDTVMRALYRRYYRQLGRGWTDEEFRRTCEAVAGASLRELFDYASTTRPVDYPKYLAYAGLQLEAPTPTAEADLGAFVEDVNGSLTVAAVEPGSTAASAGLKAGDIVESFGGERVDAGGLTAALARRKPGEEVPTEVTRAGVRQTLRPVLAARLERSWRITPSPRASALQQATLERWSAVTTPSPCEATTTEGVEPVEDCAIVAADGRVRVQRAALARMSFGRDGVGVIRIGAQPFFLTASGKNAPAFPFDNGADYFVGGLARTVRGGKIGFVSTRLTEVVPARWDFAFPFDHGFAQVCEGCTVARTDSEHSSVTGGRWGYIDRTGRVVVPVKYDLRALPAPPGAGPSARRGAVGR